jgi:hypothetical protein
MTDLSLKAGSSRSYSLTVVDDDGVPVPMADITAVVWLIKKGTTIVRTKTLEAGQINILNETGYDNAGNTVPQLQVLLPYADTVPVIGLGSTTSTMMYQHELWLYFIDGTQDAPESFAGRLTITPSVGSGVMS